ncbi:MAG: hypothetical protein U7127_25260 [Phormidium sp.]
MKERPEELNNALQAWQDKLTYLQKELAIEADSENKFKLTKRIDECREWIEKIEKQIEQWPLIPDIPPLPPPNILTAKQQHNDVGGGHMETSVTVYDTGRLDAVTRTWTNVKMAGFRGGVVVVLLDVNNHRLWASGLRTYGVDGTWIGRSNRTESWSEQVPSEVISRVSGCEIIHQHNPSDDWHRWLRNQLGL